MLRNELDRKFWYAKDTVWDNTVEFNIITDSSGVFTIDLFNGNVLSLYNTNPALVTALVTALPPLASYAIYTGTGSSTSYNQFIQDLRSNPKLVRRMVIVPDAANAQYYQNQPLQLTYRDADGIQCSYPKIVNTYFSKDQFQNFVNIDFEPGELILDNNTIISNYTFAASSLTKIILYYREIKLADMLSGAGCTICAETCDDMMPPVYSNEQLTMMDAIKVIPAKSPVNTEFFNQAVFGKNVKSLIEEAKARD